MVVALVVLALVIGRWLTTSFDDWVPLVAPAVLPEGVVQDDLPDSAAFECSAPLGAAEDPVATDQAEEAMAVQSLSRAPCEGLRLQRSVLGILDLLVIGIALAGTFVIRGRRRRSAASSVATT